MRTDFRAGGLRVDRKALERHKVLSVTPHGVPPPYWDMKATCIESSNQGSTSDCAGFAIAGFLEVQEYIRTCVPRQIDGHAIASAARRHYGIAPDDGMTLEQAARGAMELGVLDPDATFKAITRHRELEYALLRYRVCVVGFDITEEWNDVREDGWIARHDDPEPIGGHAVLQDYFWWEEADGFQNSWGDRMWGCRGHGRMTRMQWQRQFIYGLVIDTRRES